METPAFAPPRTLQIPGRWVVLCMFALGIIATALIFYYWDLHTRPFRGLTEAIGREFRHSLPKIAGGRQKHGPMQLRVALRVPFKPVSELPETETVVQRVVELARQHVKLNQYEVLEIHLFQMVPEQEAVEQAFRFTAADLPELIRLPGSSPAKPLPADSSAK